jgi:hypothetical protein
MYVCAYMRVRAMYVCAYAAHVRARATFTSRQLVAGAAQPVSATHLHPHVRHRE